MSSVLLPSGLGSAFVPNWDFAPHLQEVEGLFLSLAAGRFRKLMLSIPIRHGKSQYANLFIAWLLLSRPETRILRVMASADTCEMEALQVLEILEKAGPILTGVRLDRKKHSASHFKTTSGGELRSVGASGDVESWTFDWIIIDDIITDPYEIRNTNRRQQIYQDMHTKFFSRVNPMGNTRFVFIGSRRHPDDPQGRLLEADRGVPEADKWMYHSSPAILDEGTDHESALWPTSREFDLEGLRAVRDQKIANGVQWEWCCNFQNDPVSSPDLMAFDPAWFTPPERIFYDCPVEALPPIKHRVLAIDPSMGPGNAQNDYFAAVWLLVTATGDIFVDDSFCQQASPDAAIDQCVSLVARHQDMDVCAFEANAGGRYVEKLIRDECERRQLLLPTVFKSWSTGKAELDMGDKVGRIQLALWVKLSRGKIKLRDTPHNRIGFRQLRGFPTEHDDFPDAIATGDIVLRELLLARGKK